MSHATALHAPSVAVRGSSARFAVRRIYCVGRNYAAHAREMGGDGREPPFFFMKPADAVVANGAEVPYPPRTENLHHEVELVVAVGPQQRGGWTPERGRKVAAADALGLVFGYAVGTDLTRRDLQSNARDRGQPWDTAKGFDHSAPLTAIHPAAEIGHPERGRIWLKVNDAIRQDADIAELTWKVPEIIAELSTYFTLQPGDLIFTGTPAGVGALQPGDTIESGIEGFETLRNRIVAAG